ncbi:Hypothetical predicted protein [Paramuricea clavata]|uniref:Uncharacterized protein n=1 Tax=Paramuricea clavata TaxID=317549 RepID=A0A6S7HRG8_PARCT|nr:Hypothetical predicted protein [Paramuricea clavata]
MVINTKNTKSMLVTGKRLRKKIPDEHLQMDLALGSTTVSQVESKKLLGVIIDQDLAYEDHIDSLCKQISKRLGLLKHISPYLKKQQREIYYNGIIKPKLMLSTTRWSARIEAVKPSAKRAREIMDALKRLKDHDLCGEVSDDVNNLIQWSQSLEFFVLITFWFKVLQAINDVSVLLQASKISADEELRLIESLQDDLKRIRVP